jgi:hypothetical protein
MKSEIMVFINSFNPSVDIWDFPQCRLLNMTIWNKFDEILLTLSLQGMFELNILALLGMFGPPKKIGKSDSDFENS